MQYPWHFRVASPLLFAAALLTAGVPLSSAQSQEPKPATGTERATPVPLATPLAQTGFSGDRWLGPNFEVAITWDPAIWSVGSEQIDAGYEGVSLSSAESTVYIEAFQDASGDAKACLETATDDIASRDGVSDVTPIPDRRVPQATGAPHQLIGFVLTSSDDEPYRGLEYVECLALPSAHGMLQITWQTPASAYQDELPAVSDLLSGLELPPGTLPIPVPDLPEMPPDLEPNSVAT